MRCVGELLLFQQSLFLVGGVHASLALGMSLEGACSGLYCARPFVLQPQLPPFHGMACGAQKMWAVHPLKPTGNLEELN